MSIADRYLIEPEIILNGDVHIVHAVRSLDSKLL